jgi:hypothetical protein
MSTDRYITKLKKVLDARPELRSAVIFVSPKVTVKVTRQKRARANAKQKTYLISEGSPNFLERRMLKAGKVNKFPLIKIERFAA